MSETKKVNKKGTTVRFVNFSNHLSLREFEDGINDTIDEVRSLYEDEYEYSYCEVSKVEVLKLTREDLTVAMIVFNVYDN